MALFHFFNCILLATGPHVILYKRSGLAEYSAFWKCAQAAAGYVLTELAKMILLATFFPSLTSVSEWSLVGDLIASSVDLLDIVGLYLCLQYISGKGQFKALVVGTGWASAELVLKRYVPLWVGTRGMEFEWTHLTMSLESNLDLVYHLGTAFLVWMSGRRDRDRVFPHLVACLLFKNYRFVIFDVMSRFIISSTAVLLLIKIFASFLFGLLSLRMYMVLRQDVGSGVNSNGAKTS